MLDDARYMMRRSALEVETMAPELWIRRGPPPTMPRPHRHDDLELNVVLRGALEYLHGGQHVRLDEGSLAVFWGATPHRLLDVEEHRYSEACWIHIPLGTVLRWSLPDHQLAELLSPRLIAVPADTVGRTIVSAFRVWEEELADPDTEAIALLEAEAIIRRALRHHVARTSGEDFGPPTTGRVMSAGITMARFVLENFREPVTIDSVARAARLSTHHAMAVFRSAIGPTVGAYVIRCRVAEAQRLLITTDMSIADVAVAAGFGSQSAFYAQFTRACGRAPAAYRRGLR